MLITAFIVCVVFEKTSVHEEIFPPVVSELYCHGSRRRCCRACKGELWRQRADWRTQQFWLEETPDKKKSQRSYSRGDSSWNKWEAPVHGPWCRTAKKNWLQSKVCGIWTRQLSPLRGRYGQILKTTLREAAERRAQTICMVISRVLYWMCSSILPTSLVFKPACQQRKAALYCMEVWRDLSTKLSFWLNKNSSANLPASSNVFAFCSSMNGRTLLRYRYDWFYLNCMWRVLRNFSLLTIPNNTVCQCMFLSRAL